MSSIRVSALASAVAVLVAAVAAGAAEQTGGRWVAGDLHVHTTYSHDSWDPVNDDEHAFDEPWILGHSVASQFAIAASRDLDFLAITDHNDIRSQSDPGFGAMGVIPIPAYENSLGGHAQMLGARACYTPDGTFPGPTGCNNWSNRSDPARVEAMGDRLRADGGLLQVNHPADGDAAHPMGDWPDAYGYDVVPDSVEVWNISPLWQPPMPSSNSTDDAIAYWEGFLDRGHRVAATGGSDNHWVSTTAAQGVGQPTTWVWVTEPGVQGVLEGIRAGRTFVSSQPPAHNGPRLFLEADGDGDGEFEAMVGDAVPPGSALRARTENAPPGTTVRIVAGASGRRWIDECTVVAPGLTDCSVDHAAATWVRAELVAPDGAAQRAQACDGLLGDETTYCRNRLAILALTSPVYIASS